MFLDHMCASGDVTSGRNGGTGKEELSPTVCSPHG